MAAISHFDLSKVWRAEVITFDWEGEIEKQPFPEPVGYIGNNYQRFYIHYTSVQKDTFNPYHYYIKGKTRVGDHICNFTGTITIVKAVLFKQSDDPRYKQGEVICKVDFKEDDSQLQSGHIQGKLISNWYIDKQQRIHYDTINGGADGYSNNQCIATWTSYATHQRKPCNWGDFRMPNSKKIDIGTGDISINKQYVKNGWQNYVKAYSISSSESKVAIAEEYRKWWK